ncbi:hypothetical protein ABLE68_13690 [Nocardioides sp. CN2-186]|uniref:hypothetical protein n=1 Tax=Nocardioides tweenelious TaxID=3156607 RepID=UPI0032B51366
MTASYVVTGATRQEERARHERQSNADAEPEPEPAGQLQIIATPLEDRLDLDHVVLDPTGDTGDLVDTPHALLVDAAEADDQVDRRRDHRAANLVPRSSEGRLHAAEVER